ncbi:AMP-binding protein [Ornithinimicrobium faecis]|uniref:AMP-binding protein n=1 Tax=Ornithinimicrobium faecis TaxID=2934158 RepID=UPI0021191AE2|nr:AMP-binding protein [Ornithinimicrobium sp. HY1745]
MDIGTLVTRAGHRFGDRIAVEGTDAGDRRTFAELADRVTRLASGLLALGLRPGDRVLDLQSNSTAYLETDLAIRAAGLVRVALNYRLHPSDWERIATDCRARGLIYHEQFADGIAAVRGQVEHVVVVGDGPETSLDQLAEQAQSTVLPSRDPDDLCGLHYSSGTTGHPKGAQRTHRNWVSSVVNMTFDVLGGLPGPDDCYVHAGPVTHTSGLFVLPFLVAGARQIVLPSWDPQTFLEAVGERGATHTALVPTMVARLLSAGATREDLTGLKMLGYAGAPMPPEQMRRAHDELTPHLVQYYGLVEAIPPVTVLDAADHARGLAGEPELLTSAGRPALGVELAVVDEDGRRLAPGEVGEVITRGDHVMASYYNAAERTDLSKAVVDGWLHTGDLGRLSEDGHLWLVDRKGDMIISGGYNIYPREVEEVIAEVPGIDEVAVLGVTDADWGQRVVALVTARSGAQVTEDQVREFCASRLAAYKKPKEVRVVDELPLNSTGKIAKKVLRAQLEEEHR